MKNKLLRLIGTISAFFLSIFGLTGCMPEQQCMYGIPPDVQQDLYGVPAPTQKYEPEDLDEEIKESFDTSMSEEVDLPSEF